MPRPSDAFREVRPRVDPSPALDSALARAFAAGRAAWPGVALAEGDFIRYLAARVGDDEEPLAALSALYVADLYLACAAAAGSPPAIEAFSRRLLPDARAHLAGVGAAALAEDVKQMLLERLFVGSADSPPRIGAYAGRGPLAAWVRVSAVRLALSLRRGEREAEPIDPEAPIEPLGEEVDPELDALKVRYAADFNAALRDAFAALPARDRALLKLHYADGVPVERIAVAYQVHRVSASRWLSAARARVLEETTRLLRARQNLTSTELESLTRLVQSRLELSLRGVSDDAGG
jgi:RNA polymerase sigma-70 factor (ECF subfamily)